MVKNKTLIMECEKCKKEFEVSYDTFSKRRRLGRPHYCKECFREYNSNKRKEFYNNLPEEEKERRRQQKKDHWNNLPQEVKDLYSKRTKEQLAKRTAEEWEEINAKNSAGLKRHWEKLSEEDKLKRITPMLEAAWKSWDDLSPEERSKRAKKWMENKTQEEIEEIMLGYSLRMKEYNNSLPYAEKVKRVKHMNDYLKALTKEERKEIAQKAHEWIDKMSIEESWEYYKNNLRRMILSKEFTTSELEFINHLKIASLGNNYIPQYINEIADKNILKEFPDIRNPYHIWDFRIRTKEKDIYVDIDGSIHSIKEKQCFTTDGIDIGLQVINRDRKRPYQTDGLDAYVIKALNDKITSDTIVQNVKTGKEIKFKDFLNSLIIMNMSKAELKLAMKLV